MTKNVRISISLTDDERAAIKACCPGLDTDALTWQKTRALILLDAKEKFETICRLFDIDLTDLTEWVRAWTADGLASLSPGKDSQAAMALTDEERIKIRKFCRRRKVDALSWKRAQAITLLDIKVDPETICLMLDIGRTVLTEWRRAFATKRLEFFDLKDYSQREGHLTFEQEKALKKHFTDIPPSDTNVIRAYILAEYGQKFSISGATKLMKRMDFVYKKPIALAMQADEVAQ